MRVKSTILKIVVLFSVAISVLSGCSSAKKNVYSDTRTMHVSEKLAMPNGLNSLKGQEYYPIPKVVNLKSSSRNNYVSLVPPNIVNK